MGQPAARVGDMHTCPMVTGTVPHVGGPVLPPCHPTVLIAGMPAARLGDTCTCVGPPDTIAQGEPTVLIGNKPAARLGDATVHGGVIAVGCPTVLIGVPHRVPFVPEDDLPLESPLLDPIDLALIAVSGLRLAAKGLQRGGMLAWNAVNGPGPLGAKVAATFRGASYTQSVTKAPTTLYRSWGGKAGELGPYWTRTPPSGPLQSRIDSALLPQWGNTATNVTTIRVPPGVTIFEGSAAQQGGLVGGGSQVVIQNVDPSWIVK